MKPAKKFYWETKALILLRDLISQLIYNEKHS